MSFSQVGMNILKAGMVLDKVGWLSADMTCCTLWGNYIIMQVKINFVVASLHNEHSRQTPHPASPAILMG